MWDPGSDLMHCPSDVSGSDLSRWPSDVSDPSDGQCVRSDSGSDTSDGQRVRRSDPTQDPTHR